MHQSFPRFARKTLCVLISAGAVFAAGCHQKNRISGYGIAWVTLSDTPGDFTSYIVNVDSVVLTGARVGAITAVSSVQTVDFTKLKNYSELWASANVPNDTYSAASITLDYTNANVSVMVNGVPVKATVLDPTGAALKTTTVKVHFDANHPLVIDPTTGSSSAKRLAIDLDLAASNVVNLTAAVPTVTVKPFITAATSAPDNKLVRVRGPLVNSSVNLGTYSVYVRPFFDQVSSLGALSIFTSGSTIYQVNGSAYVGSAGVTALSQTSAGTTLTAAYTSFEPTLAGATSAGKFTAVYVIGGSSLEDYYTQGLEGDVIARSGNTLKLRGSTLQLNNGTSSYNNADAVVLIGPKTLVTADRNVLTGLNYNAVAVGQHIAVRGIYSLPTSGIVTLDATGVATNTGSVRIQSAQLYGSLLAVSTGSLLMNLQTINNWPVSVYNFAGNGASAAQDPVPTSFSVDTTAAPVPAGTVAGAPLWIDGLTSQFGAAPPDYKAFAINAESSVPATLHVTWTSAGTVTPFVLPLTGTELTIDLKNANLSSGVIRIGSQSIDLKSLPASPPIVPSAAPPSTALPAVFLPLFAVGNPSATTGIATFNTFSAFTTNLGTSISAVSPVVNVVATGTYDRGGNTFTASRINVVN